MKSNFAAEKSIKTSAVLNMIKTVMGVIFPLITFPYASRILQPAGLGKITFANAVVSYFSMIAALGINMYGVREVAKLRNDRAALTKFTKEIFTINMISTMAACILLGLAILFLPHFAEYRNLLIVCGTAMLFIPVGMDWLYTGLEEFAYIVLRSLAFQVISLILLFIFVRTKDDYLKYAAVGVISSVGINVCNFIHARKFILFNMKTDRELRSHLRPIFTLFFMSVAVSIYTVLDTTMLGFIAGDEQVGLYTAATRLNRVVVSVISAATAVLLPRLSFYISQNNSRQFFELSEKGLNLIILLSLPCAVGLSLIARPVIFLLCGSQYEAAVPIMKIMNPIIVAISLSGLIGVQIFIPLGKEKVTFFSVVLGAMINFCLNIIFIPRRGALGAGIATVCAECFVSFFQFAYAHTYFDLKKILIHAVQCLASCGILFFCVQLLVNIEMPVPIMLFISIMLGSASYFFGLALLGNQFFLSLLKEFFKR